MDTLFQPKVSRAKRAFLAGLRVSVILTIIFVLYYVGRDDHLFFHSLAEFITITIAAAIFMIFWNSRHLIKNNYLLFVAIAFVFVAGLDLVHLMTYGGMDVFHIPPEDSLIISTQLWFVARYLQAVSLLIAPFFVKKRLDYKLMILMCGIITIVVLILAFYGQNLSFLYRVGQDAMVYKSMLEYIVLVLFVISGIFLYVRRRYLDQEIYKYLILMIVLSVFSELCFALSKNAYDIFIIIGHIFKVLAFYMVYVAVIVVGLRRSSNMLFRELKLSEEKLKRQSQQLQIEKDEQETLLSSIGEGIVAVDNNEVVMYVNDAFLRIVDRKEAWLKGRPLKQLVELYDENDNFVKFEDRPLSISMRTKQSVYRENYYILRSNGEKIYLKIASSAIVSHGEFVGAIAVWEDVTEHHRIERSKSEFISFAAHQLKTPLSTISISLEMLMMGNVGKIDNEAKQQIRDILKDTKSMTHIIKTFLDISRIEMGIYTISPKPENILEVLDVVIEEVLPQLYLKILKLEKKYSKNIPMVNVDSRIIEIVMENLLTNAIKYSPEKSIITISVILGEKDIIVEVSDMGKGVSKAEAKKVFKKLFRGNNTQENQGTGLGLYIAKTMIEQAGGKIWLSSPSLLYKKTDQNPGSTFFFSIPLSGMKKTLPYGEKSI